MANAYRLAVVTIRAFRLTEDRMYDADMTDWPEWLKEARKQSPEAAGAIYYDTESGSDQQMIICLGEGDTLRVAPGDWIVRTATGALIPMPHRQFSMVYEEVV